jgi:hypothetical protein
MVDVISMVAADRKDRSGSIARVFDFLTSDSARLIFASYGYTVLAKPG